MRRRHLTTPGGPLPPLSLRRTGDGRRGSTFIVVLAILSLLVLVATALSLTSRLEVVSAANYADGIQSRMAAKTGLGIASARAALENGAPSTLSARTASLDASALPTHPALSNAGVVDLRALAATQNVSLANVWTLDASARINLNTADADTLARLFAAVAANARVNDGNPQTLARSIVEWREGGDTSVSQIDIRSHTAQQTRRRQSLERASGRTLTEIDTTLRDQPTPDFRQADLRVPPLHKERRIASLTELLSLPGASPALISAASPYLTVFSSSKVLANTASGPLPLVDLNAIDARQTFDALQSLYTSSAKNKRLLEQFAVNLVDWRDADRVPTAFPSDTPGDPVLGLERTPFLTEVWPNTIYPEETGGAGQFVELYNPWSDSMDVTGWTLAIGGSNVALRGRIEPAGYLVVTDVYDGMHSINKTSSDTPFASFYDVFGVLGNGSTHRVLENPDLRLPWNEGTYKVELRDDQGQLIDYFTYTIKTSLKGQKTSFQRRDPRIRLASTGACTPFAFPFQVQPFIESADPGENRYPADRPFLSSTEVLKVFAGWADPAAGLPYVGFPVLAVPGSPDPAKAREASASSALDARLLDLFEVGDAVLWKLAAGEDPASSDATEVDTADSLSAADVSLGDPGLESDTGGGPSTRIQAALDRLSRALTSSADKRELATALAEHDRNTVAALATRAFLPLEPDTRLGCVNLNTAPRTVLGALPGLNDTIAAEWVEERKERQTRERSAESVVLFVRPSDLLANEAFWGADSRADARYRRLTSLLPAITFSTSSVFMDSRTRVQEPAPSQSRQPAVSRAVALVAFDRGRIEFVAWSQTP